VQRIYVIGTADTKGAELQFLRQRIADLGGSPIVIDIGTKVPTIETDISAREVAGHHPNGADAPLGGNDRGAAVASMSVAFERFIATRTDVAAVIGIGGGGGTSMITAGMRTLPIGVPKLMVSTLASGDTAPFVGVSDIVMMPSITDLAGLNRISRTVLSNAARAIVGMAARTPEPASARPAVGLTMFGVTTPAVTRIVELLGDMVEPVVFHATGTGGRSMEALVDSGLLSAVIDITTTEVADLLFGGVMPAGPDRFDCIARTKVPWVGSVGACDMVNFWAPETMPEKYRDRLIYRHNPNITLMRTTPEENRAIGTWIAEKLNRCGGPVRLLLPENGVSMLDSEGAAFWDPVADAALFEAIGTTLTDKSRLRRLPLHINDPAFADAVVAAFREFTS
jgi:uncharacterized protein (UPF0261 family)